MLIYFVRYVFRDYGTTQQDVLLAYWEDLPVTSQFSTVHLPYFAFAPYFISLSRTARSTSC